MTKHWYLFSFSLVFTGPFAGAQSVEEILSRQQDRFLSLRSLQVASDFVMVAGRGTLIGDNWELDSLEDSIQPERIAVRQQVEFTAKRDLFRSAVELTPGQASTQRFEEAYDGAFQIFSPEGSELSVQKEPPTTDRTYMVTPAFLNPYRFASFNAPGPFDIEMLRDAEIWTTLAKSGSIVGRQAVGDSQCIVIDFEVPEDSITGENAKTRVFFAPDKDYFPVRFERFRGESLVRISQAYDIELVAGDDGFMFYVERRGVNQAFDASTGEPMGGRLYENDVEEIRVNFPIQDEFFTIPIGLAKTYANKDAPWTNFSDRGQNIWDPDIALRDVLEDDESPPAVKTVPPAPAAAVPYRRSESPEPGSREVSTGLVLVLGVVLVLVGGALFSIRRN